jgi:hypothetical protein
MNEERKRTKVSQKKGKGEKGSRTRKNIKKERQIKLYKVR